MGILPDPDPEGPRPPTSTPAKVVSFPARQVSVEQTFNDRLAAIEVNLTPSRDQLIRRVDTFQVSDSRSYELAGELLKTLQGLIKDGEVEFEDDIHKAYELHQSLCQRRNRFLDPLRERLQLLKTRALAWYQGEQRRRQDEQQRIQREAQEREQARLRREAEEARQSGDHCEAAQIEEQAAHVPPPPVHVPSTVPQVSGVAAKSKWTFQVYDCKALVLAIARPLILRELVDEIRAAQPADAARFLEEKFLECPSVPVAAVIADDKYLRGRAKNDKDTLRWPGVNFYDEGSLAVRK
jgi:hypothetical protein